MKHLGFFSLIIIFICSCNTHPENKASAVNSTIAFPPNVISLMQQVSQTPDSVGLRFQLATSLDSIGAYKPALLQLDTLLQKDTSNYGVWFARGQILQDAKDTADAEKSFIRAIKIYPSPDAMLSLANLYAEQKKPESLMICSRIKDLSQGKEYDAHCAFIAGVYNARAGNKEQALKLFDECISDDFTYMEAYIEKGLIYFDNKNYRKALQVFQFASNVNNLYADAYYYMARCYEMMGIKDSAVLRFKQSLSLDKTMVEAQEGIKRTEK